jgi:hypothetical protein
MKRAVKTTIISLTVCLLLAVPGWAQSAKLDSHFNSAIFQRDKPPEKPKERPKDDKRGEEKRDDKKDDKRKKPDFF